MGKRSIISELTNVLAIALRHKIGSIVNEKEIYAQKYARDADVLLNQAKLLALKKNFNFKDKQKIKEQLRLKLEKELKESPELNKSQTIFSASCFVFGVSILSFFHQVINR